MRIPSMPRRRASGAKHRSTRQRRLTLEALEQRWLLTATLIRLGSPAGTFQTIQAAINNARTNDAIEISGGTYGESLNLSNMGSAIGRGPGNLTIRGTGATSAAVIVNSPGGPALFNSAAFGGNLTIEKVTLQSPSSTPADDTGLDLNNYSGNLRVSDSRVQTTAGSAIDITNSSGNFSFSMLAISNVGNSSTHHALNLQNVDATVALLDSNVMNVAGSGVVVSNGAGTEMRLIVHGSEIIGDPGFVSTNDGVRIQATAGARVDASITDNDFFDLDGSALRFDVSGASQAQVYAGDNRINNVDQESAVVVNLNNSALGAFSFQDNDVASTGSGGFSISANDSSSLNLFMDNNFLNDIGDAAADDAIKLSSNAGSTATINAYFGFNAVVTSAGAGLHVRGIGGATFNVTAVDNFFVDFNAATSPAVVLFQKTGPSNTAKFNFDVARNIATDLNVPSYVLTQAGSGVFNLEGNEANAQAQLEATNTGETFTVNGAVSLAAPGAFDNSTPGILGGYVWEDDNANGIQDAGEAPYVGLEATLTGTTTGGAAVLRPAATGGDGMYRFSAVLPGNYSIEIENPVGFTLAPANQGGNDDLDSEFSRQGLVINPLAVMLAPADTNDVNDAGMMPNYQNPENPLDSTGDQFVAPDDALAIINELILNGARQLFFPAPLPRAPIFIDIDGDDFLAPNDALFIINFLISLSPPPPQGEGESPLIVAPQPASDASAELRAAGRSLLTIIESDGLAGPAGEASRSADDLQLRSRADLSPARSRAVDLALAKFFSGSRQDAVEAALQPLDEWLSSSRFVDEQIVDMAAADAVTGP